MVAVAEAGLLETVNEQTGVLTPRGESAFADAVSQLLIDDERRVSMGRLGRERVLTTFNWRNTGMHVEKNLKAAIETFREGGK